MRGFWRGLRWLQGYLEDAKAPERSRVQVIAALWRLPGVPKVTARRMNLLKYRAEARASQQRKAS